MRRAIPIGKAGGRRRNAAGRIAPARAAGAALLLGAVLLLAAGCTTSGPGYVDRKIETAEIDYQARHEAMLDTVLERPARLERYRLENEQRQRTRSLSAWEQVLRRNEGFIARRQEASQGDREAYLRMLERISSSQRVHETVRNERWAQFLEATANPGAPQAPAPGAPSPRPPRP